MWLSRPISVNPMSRTEEVRHIAGDAGARVALCGQELVPMMRPLVDAGVLDGGTSDAGAPAYVSLHGGAGCSCRVAGPGVPVDGGSPGGLPAVLFLASVFTWRIRRKLL